MRLDSSEVKGIRIRRRFLSGKLPSPTMAQHTYKYFNVGFPQECVAHVEINRPGRLNAFIEA